MREDAFGDSIQEKSKECCVNCRFRHVLKEIVNKEWSYKDICTVLIETEDNPSYDDFAITVRANGKCEMFTRRESK